MTLAILANEENWQALDDAWVALIESAGPIDELLPAIEAVASKRRMARYMAMIRTHADALGEAGRPSDAAVLLGTALRGGGPVGEISDALLQQAESAWSEEPWWTSFRELANFFSGSPDMRKSWSFFDDMRSYQPGIVIFHAAGWGTGEVMSVSVETLEVDVTFQSGRKDRFPLRTAVEIFERLPESDLRVQHLRDPDSLKKRIKKEPIEVLRSVLLRYGGKASHVTLRNALMQIGIQGTAWTNWWRKARVEAENSEWFRVSGNATRAEVELLRRATDPVEALQRQLRNAPNLKKALTRVKDLFGASAVEDGVRTAALEAIDTHASDPKEPLAQRMAAWMLLREHRKETPAPLLALLQSALEKEAPSDPSVPPALWKLLNAIPGAREQEQALEILTEVGGEGWADDAARNIQHAPAGMVNALLAKLIEAGKQAELGQQYAWLLARPTRAPFALIGLARYGEDGELEGELQTPAQRGLALIELAVYLNEKKRGDAIMTRAHQRLVDLLTKKPDPLLSKLLAGATADDMRSVRTALQRGVDDPIDAALTDVAFDKGMDLFKMESVPFWKEDRIWTTRAGLEKRENELRELHEVKIPENAEAIARAASFGDLSENSEWENAIEEQRLLTGAAATIESELRIASLLENATLPEDTVCPGTAVRYQEVASGSEHTVQILGPWDDEEGSVSYRAPLAAGMLGLKVGDNASIALPAGAMEVKILGIDMAVKV